jgi:NitT/TauT family transport system permease protein
MTTQTTETTDTTDTTETTDTADTTDTIVVSASGPASAPATAVRPVSGRDRAAGRWARRLATLLSRTIRRTVAIAAFLALWEVVARVGLVDPTWLPPFSRVLQSWVGLAASGQLTEHVVVSLERSLTGFLLAIVVAVPLGLLIAWYRPVADVLDPLLEIFRNTAALALLPVFTLILGIGETSKIALIVFACLWPILLNTISGVRGVDPLLIKSARSVGLSSARLFQMVILPAALPTIFTGIRLSGAVSILMLIAAEMVGAKSGLGYLINNTQFNFQIPEMYAGIVTVSVIGVAFNYGLVRVERRLSRWRNG